PRGRQGVPVHAARGRGPVAPAETDGPSGRWAPRRRRDVEGAGVPGGGARLRSVLRLRAGGEEYDTADVPRRGVALRRTTGRDLRGAGGERLPPAAGAADRRGGAGGRTRKDGPGGVPGPG